MLARDWEASLVHVYREANMCADFLAKKGVAGSSYSLIVLEDIPDCLVNSISADRLGSLSMRG